MSWYQLLDIRKHAQQEFEWFASTPPLSCPNDGEPLINSPATDSGSGAELFCKFDGFQYPRDHIRPQPL